MAESRVRSAWRNMHKRCYGKHIHGHRWKGRGIIVEPRWHDFANFLADMGEPPAGMSLERERLNENYGPGNCRWATRHEQAWNTSRTRYVEIDGKSVCLAQACRERGLNRKTVTKRLASGWPIERAFS